MNFLGMLFIVFLILCAMHLIIYYTFFSKAKKYNASYLIIGLLVCNLLFILHHYILLPYAIEMFFSICLGVSFLLFSGAIFYYLSLLPFLLFANKRQCFLIMPYLKTIALIFAIGGIFYGLYNGLIQKPIVKNIEITVPKLKKDLRIVQISDLHIDTLSKESDLKYIINKINTLQSDAIMLTGDIVDSKIEYIKNKVMLLKNLQAKYGVYYVLGNHEYYYDTKTILDTLRDAGIIILNNTSTIINIDSRPVINIVGITDLSGNKMGFLQPNIQQAIFKGNPNIPSILLSHQPKVIEYMHDKHVDLILSGHTHGGQIFPFNFLVALEQPYIKGLHQYKNNSYIYVNQGTGFWGPPMRLGTFSEITLITLKSQE